MARIGKYTGIPEIDTNGDLLCKSCGNYKSSENYHKGVRNKNRFEKSHICKICSSGRNRKVVRKSSENLEGCLYQMFQNTRTRSKKKKLLFDIDLEFLKYLYNKQNGKCALSGIEMTYYFGYGRSPKNVSIDKINPSKGYVKTNVRLVCSHVNMMKSYLTDSELVEFCKAIIKECNEKE